MGRFAFAHALVGEAIASALPASRRARLHLQVAEVLAGRHDAREVGAGEVVRHLRGAGTLADDERLATWELAAAREATAALADSDAAAHYEAALAAGARDPSAARCCSRSAARTTGRAAARRPAPRSRKPPRSPASRATATCSPGLRSGTAGWRSSSPPPIPRT